MQNTHEIAQAITPASRIVYVDNDPLVLAHARALLVNTTLDRLAECFAGLEPVEPGPHWRLPESAGDAQPIDAYGAVARKP